MFLKQTRTQARACAHAHTHTRRGDHRRSRGADGRLHAQERGLGRPGLPTPGSWTSSLRDCERKMHCLRPWLCGTWSPRPQQSKRCHRARCLVQEAAEKYRASSSLRSCRTGRQRGGEARHCPGPTAPPSSDPHSVKEETPLSLDVIRLSSLSIPVLTCTPGSRSGRRCPASTPHRKRPTDHR